MSLFILVTHGTAGDIIQLVQLAGGLRARGHDAVLISHAPYAERARAAGLGFVPIDSPEGYQRHLSATTDLLGMRAPAELREFYRRGGLFAQCRLEVEAIRRLHRPGETVLLGRHGSALSVLVAAELLGAPSAWVALYPSQLMTAGINAYFIQRGLAADLDELRAGYGLAPVPDWRAWLGSTDLLLGLWPQWFDRAGTPAPAGARVTGFIPGDGIPGDGDFASAGATGPGDAHAPGDTSPPGHAHPPGGAPAVLVTGGTGRMLHADYYRVAVAAAAEVGRPTLVVTPHRDLLPDRLPDGITWLPEAPFTELLPSVGAIIHHGGIGTAMRALRSGTPQLILAHGLDRPDNAARLAAHDLARWLGPADWNVPAVTERLRETLADTGYRERAARAVRADDDSAAVRAAAEALEGLLRPAAGNGAARVPEGGVAR